LPKLLSAGSIPEQQAFAKYQSENVRESTPTAARKQRHAKPAARPAYENGSTRAIAELLPGFAYLLRSPAASGSVKATAALGGKYLAQGEANACKTVHLYCMYHTPHLSRSFA
jgi:hypothetical protein